MPSHWTYAEVFEQSDLKQGDLIEHTPELAKAISDLHTSVTTSDVTGYVILTQSCDLVRRDNGLCDAEFISLAVVKGLKEELPRILARQFAEDGGVFLDSVRNRANDLLDRIFNHNEQTLGLFYLHPDADAGIAVHSIAFLRDAFTLRADSYALLAGARRGRLAVEFSNRLGWISGHLLSRIGTRDWADIANGKKDLQNLKKQFLKPDSDEPKFLWATKEELAWLRNNRKPDQSLNDLRASLRTVKVERKKDRVLARVIEIVGKQLSLESSALEKLKSALSNDEQLSAELPKGS